MKPQPLLSRTDARCYQILFLLRLICINYMEALYRKLPPENIIEKINQVIEEALKEAGVTLDDLDAIGVTYGPGLVGALLVGVAEAKLSALQKTFLW